MPPSPKLSVELKIECEVLTASSVADVINASLEFLLYQRNQIPFIYKTYEYYVCGWSEDEEYTDDGVIELELQRQRLKAKQTKDAISAMKQLIKISLEQGDVKCIRFLFGSTASTPKEIYIIHIPTEAIARNHYLQNHHVPDSSLSKTLLSLLTCGELFTIFSTTLCTTNMFLELEMQPDFRNTDQLNVFPKDICQLPASCKEIHLHLVHTRPADIVSSLQCCKDLQIFEDLVEFNIECTQHKSTESGEDRSVTKQHLIWWEADIIVRGFKEKSIKGVNLWSK